MKPQSRTTLYLYLEAVSLAIHKKNHLASAQKINLGLTGCKPTQVELFIVCQQVIRSVYNGIYEQRG